MLNKNFTNDESVSDVHTPFTRRFKERLTVLYNDQNPDSNFLIEHPRYL